jgi:hypothetical protein
VHLASVVGNHALVLAGTRCFDAAREAVAIHQRYAGRGPDHQANLADALAACAFVLSVALYRQIQPRLFAYIDDTLREGYEQIITALNRSGHQRESAALRKEVPPRQR